MCLVIWTRGRWSRASYSIPLKSVAKKKFWTFFLAFFHWGPIFIFVRISFQSSTDAHYSSLSSVIVQMPSKKVHLNCNKQLYLYEFSYAASNRTYHWSLCHKTCTDISSNPNDILYADSKGVAKQISGKTFIGDKNMANDAYSPYHRHGSCTVRGRWLSLLSRLWNYFLWQVGFSCHNHHSQTPMVEVVTPKRQRSESYLDQEMEINQPLVGLSVAGPTATVVVSHHRLVRAALQGTVWICPSWSTALFVAAVEPAGTVRSRMDAVADAEVRRTAEMVRRATASACPSLQELSLLLL